jgi:hypothetical protein
VRRHTYSLFVLYRLALAAAVAITISVRRDSERRVVLELSRSQDTRECKVALEPVGSVHDLLAGDR